MDYITAGISTKEHVQRLARYLNMVCWPSQENPFLPQEDSFVFPNNLVLISKITDETQLAGLLKKPVSAIIDANAPDVSICDFLKTGPDSDATVEWKLELLLTCPVLFKCDIPFLLTREFQKRHSELSDSLLENMRIAMHESLVNGLIHGNLQLSSALKQSAREYIEYARLLNERLNNPLYARKCIGIRLFKKNKHLIIKIRDEGQGFPTLTALQTRPPCLAKTGRGFDIITHIVDSCVLSDFGREITLTFLIRPTVAPRLSPIAPVSPQTTVKAPDLSSCRLLLIDSERKQHLILTDLLNSLDIRQVDSAFNLHDGLKKSLSEKPDLIIIDRSLLFFDKTSFIARLKEQPATQDIPVIVQTDANTRQIRDRLFSSGAVDFITKPINPLQFFSRVKLHLDNRLLIKNLEFQLTAFEEELRAAQNMQANMLPSANLLQHIRKKYRLDLAQAFIPSSSLGGDFWQAFDISSSKVGLYLSDFSGHGVAAALNTFRLHTLISQISKKSLTSPAEFLKNLNTQLYHLLPRGQFATFFFIIFDIRQKTATYAGAGCVPPLLLHNATEKRLTTTGLPLGIKEHFQYTNETVSFGPGDKMVLISDALTEAKLDNGRRTGYAYITKLIRAVQHIDDSREALKNVMRHFFEKTPVPPHDDVTAIFLRFEEIKATRP